MAGFFENLERNIAQNSNFAVAAEPEYGRVFRAIVRVLSKVNSPFAKAYIGIVIFWRTSSASRNRQSVFSGLRRLLVTVSLFLADFVGLLVVVSLFWRA